MNKLCINVASEKHFKSSVNYPEACSESELFKGKNNVLLEKTWVRERQTERERERDPLSIMSHMLMLHNQTEASVNWQHQVWPSLRTQTFLEHRFKHFCLNLLTFFVFRPMIYISVMFQPNCLNKCWHCMFLQTIDVLKHLCFCMLKLDVSLSFCFQSNVVTALWLQSGQVRAQKPLG